VIPRRLPGPAPVSLTRRRPARALIAFETSTIRRFRPRAAATVRRWMTTQVEASTSERSSVAGSGTIRESGAGRRGSAPSHPWPGSSARAGPRPVETRRDQACDGRAIGPGAVIRVGEINAIGPVHDRPTSPIRTRLEISGGERNIPRLQKAQWLRQAPESRATSRKLRDTLLAEESDDRQSLRESAARYVSDPDGPRLAVERPGSCRRDTLGVAFSKHRALNRLLYRDRSSAFSPDLARSNDYEGGSTSKSAWSIKIIDT
jgi:hypothetical protein